MHHTALWLCVAQWLNVGLACVGPQVLLPALENETQQVRQWDSEDEKQTNAITSCKENAELSLFLT